MTFTNNSQRNRHQSTVRKSKDQLFAFYDAQPAATRRLFQDFPENLWPVSYSDHFLGFTEAHKRYLANLKNVWGADHPAVIDAAPPPAETKSSRLPTPTIYWPIFNQCEAMPLHLLTSNLTESKMCRYSVEMT